MKALKPLITEKDIQNWFKNRNLRLLSYQDKCILSVNDSLFKNIKFPTILAACPSAGKTSMCIAYVDFYTKANSKAKVLVLTHGTTLLRTQFYKNIQENNVDFTCSEIVPDQKNFDAQVIIAIPQTLRTVKNLPKFDLLIVDEAHHFYLAEGKGKKSGKIGQVSDLISKIKPKHQLLLTGTPSIFIKKRYPIIPITIEQLLEENVITDVIVELATSCYDFKNTDFNQSYDLKELASKKLINQKNTDTTLDELLGYVLKRLTSAVKNNPSAYANIGTVTKLFTGKSWSDALSTLKKTMFACDSIEQANMVKTYLNKKKIEVALSTSENDKDSLEIDRFVNDSKCLVLIVVNRGILGFNLPELENVIDMSCTYNPDKIFQLMGRVLRKHPKGKQKLFFKVVPSNLSNLYRGVMQVVALLSNEKYYTKFDGKNMLDIKLFAELENTRKRKNKVRSGKTKSTTSKHYVPIKFEGVPFFKLFNDLYHQDNAILNGIAYVTLREVIDRIKGYHTTIDEVIAELEAIHNV